MYSKYECAIIKIVRTGIDLYPSHKEGHTVNKSIIKSNYIFDSIDDKPYAGYIIMNGNRIESITNEIPQINPEDTFLDYTDKFVSAGFVDTHCFFTGWLLQQLPQDISELSTLQQFLDVVRLNDNEVLLYSNNRLSNLNQQFLNEHVSKPIIVFDQYLESVEMNDLAYEMFKFDNSTCYSEGFWRLLKYILNLPQAKDYFLQYQAMLNSFGITSMKEMGFDDYFGFDKTLATLRDNDELTTRVHFMSQPVGQPMNLEHGIRMRDLYHDEYLAFSGYNQMTDGSISQNEGLLKEPYRNQDFLVQKDIDWDTLTKDTLLADENGFRFSLHAQGDGAIYKSLEIFNQCRKDDQGRLVNRHAMTDLEYSDSDDFKLMGELGVVAEVYPQIMSLYTRQEKLDTIDDKLGEDRRKDYWNRRAMTDHGVIISCATDLPLLFDDIPQSVYHSVHNLFKDSEIPFNKENSLSVSELLKAWTINGQYNLDREKILGTLEPGKLADITILSENIFDTNPQDLKDVHVELTIVGGKVVYRKQR